MRRLQKVMIVVVLGMMMVVSACESGAETAAERLWMAQEAENFLNMYKVAYERVNLMQGTPHPCTKGHKAAEAALFHAVLTNMHEAYTGYKGQVTTKLEGLAKTDVPIKETLAIIDNLAKPFADRPHVNQCGKVDEAVAKEGFYLQAPVEALQAVATLRTRINDVQ